MAEKLTLNPWKTMWKRPRDTIREIAAVAPRHQLWIMSIVYGLPTLLHMAQNIDLGEKVSLGFLVAVALIVSPLAGMLGIHIVAALLKITGKWIGGTASFSAVRAAVAWSCMPNLGIIAMWLLLIMRFGLCVFVKDFPSLPFKGGDLAFVLLVFLIQLAASIWSFVLLLQSLSQVQGFSVWKALWNVVIPSLIVIALLQIAAYLMM